MENKDKSVYFELLKMAKEIVVNEYIDRRAQDHNKWLADSDVAWKLRRVKLPYPTIPPYPTEKEIVARAQTLYDFLENKNSDKEFSEVLKTPKPAEKENVLVSPTPEKGIPIPEPSAPEPSISVEPEIVVPVEIPQPEPLLIEEPILTATNSTATETIAVNTSTVEVSNTATVIPPQQNFGVSVNEITEIARIKVSNDLDEETTTVGRLLPSFLKKLEEMKRLL